MDKLKDVIEDFLRKRLKSKLQKETKMLFNWQNLSVDQESEISEDAIVIVNTLIEFSRLLPLSYRLSEIGRLLEEQGKISILSEAYDEAAVNYFSEMLGFKVPNSETLQ